ncbi:NADH-quinone oxidoreductase subunit L [Egicoccus sp. AB-alg2]|uniref:NADH-quinone oxidoreductase subunit L n=1 Tax=Egicoccus sp. AB-alg2 TaxID=3242693 RepID=UPI00359E6F6F
MEALLDYAWLVVVLPLVSAVLTAAFGKLMPLRGSEFGIAAVGIALVLSLLIGWHTFTSGTIEPVEHAFRWSPLGGGFVLELGMLVDGLTAMMFVLVTTVSLLVHVYSREYMAHEPRFTYFFAMLSLFTFSMLVLVIANNTLQALIGWELVGLCSFLLIGFYWEEKSNQDAANKAFLVTKFGDVGLIVGVIVLSVPMFALAENGQVFNILQLNEAAAAGELATGTVVLGMLMIFLACISKSGQMPLHVWLPDAMAGPTPVSALIHAATMVTAGVFLLARLYPVLAQSAVVMTIVAVVGIITLFFGGLVALVQDDIKKVLAYSTVSQLGYMIAALGVGGYTAGIFHLFTHGFFKALLFLGSGSLIHAVHSNNMSDMGGMRKYMPHTYWTFIVGSLALAGFPMTAGFFSKDEILVSGQIWSGNGFVTGDLVFWVGLAAAFVTTFYMARACFLIFTGDFRGGHDTHGDPDVKHQAAQAAGVDPELVGHGVAEDAAEVQAHEQETVHVAAGGHAPAAGGGGSHDAAANAGAHGVAGGSHAVGHDDGHGGGHGHGHGGHHEPHESGLQMVVPLVILAVLSLTVGLIGSPLWTAENNFETWTATPILEEATYPFVEGGGYGEGEEDHGAEAAGLQGGGVLAAGPSVLAAAEEGAHPEILHGPPSWHFDVLALALVAFLAAVALAYRLYGRGLPAEDPTFKMGALSKVLVAKYGFDTFGYRYVVVPVRDKLATWATDFSNNRIDGWVAGAGTLTKRAAESTYQVLDQKVIDGGVNGAAFSAAWWSDRLKRLQSGDVQRYAGAIVAGTIVLVLAFAAAR